MRNGIKGIAFDLDGTLYPNYRLNIRLLPFIFKESRLLSAFGKTRGIIRREQEESIKNSHQFSVIGSSIPQEGLYEYQADITAKILGISAEQCKEKIEKLIYKGWEPLFKKIKLYKNVIKTLDAFKNAGLKLGLLSDFPPETKLEYLKLNGIWDVVHCSESSGVIKPHPLPFIKLAAEMGLPCENILYAGNSHSYDVAGAHRAGMKTAWIRSPLGVAHKAPRPDFSFSNYRQLYKFMLDNTAGY
ncbi:MAG: HAD family hydrolase [Treponema sp.]|nr:HAD family hydrolase [Treponema sp.]